jgi:orotidine-5'-phosphate decarboxylase
MDGVVSSAQEIELIKQLCGKDFLTVTPGIRPAGSEAGDQRRIMTPQEAVNAGGDYLVVGRPITQAENPKEACMGIISSL